MKLVLMAIGALLCVFGVADLVGSYAGFDLWGGVIGVQLPEVVWKYSAYIELVAGYFIFKAGMSSSPEMEADTDTQNA